MNDPDEKSWQLYNASADMMKKSRWMPASIYALLLMAGAIYRKLEEIERKLPGPRAEV